MLWLKFYFLQSNHSTFTTHDSHTAAWMQFIVSMAPIMTFITSVANLLLAIYIFKFTRNKNDSDRNIKWFQELIYTPNKEVLFGFFTNLNNIKGRIPSSTDLSNDDRIEIMDLIKAERNKFLTNFVDLIKPIAPAVHKEISKSVDSLIDELTQTVDDDDLKLNHEKIYNREIANKITSHRNKIFLSLFEYKG